MGIWALLEKKQGNRYILENRLGACEYLVLNLDNRWLLSLVKIHVFRVSRKTTWMTVGCSAQLKTCSPATGYSRQYEPLYIEHRREKLTGVNTITAMTARINPSCWVSPTVETKQREDLPDTHAATSYSRCCALTLDDRYD